MKRVLALIGIIGALVFLAGCDEYERVEALNDANVACVDHGGVVPDSFYYSNTSEGEAEWACKDGLVGGHEH